MKVYYDHAFPSSWSTGLASRMVIDLFASQLPDWMNDTLIMDPGYGKVEDVLNHYSNFDAGHKIAICFNDTYSLCKDKADLYLGEGQYNVISMANYQQFWYFGFYGDLVMRRYKNQDFPLDLKYVFLNYNRKPKPQRVDLVNRLVKAGVDKHGIVTLGVFDGTAYEIQTIPENSNIKHANDFKFHGIPNDITSLGDLGIWNQCLVNVVSETSHAELFLSEKTVKPIVGKRPFIINGACGSLDILKQWGFKTFDAFWDESYDQCRWPTRNVRIVEIIEQLCKMTETELLAMYEEMQPILEHNHHHFFTTFRKKNLEGLNNMAKTYVDYFFGENT